MARNPLTNRHAATLRGICSRSRPLLLALAIGVACAHSTDDSDPPDGAAGATSHEGGAAGAGGVGGAAGSSGSANAGAADAGNGGAGGATATPNGGSSSGGSAGAGSGGAALGAAGDAAAGGVGGAPPAGPVLQLPGAEVFETPPPDPLNPKLVPSIIELVADDTTTNGGTTRLRLRTSAPLRGARFVVALVEEPGHFVVQAAETDEIATYDIELHIGRSVRLPELTVRIAPMDELGNIGAYQTVVYTVIHSGNGDVRVTLSFDVLADLDLSVIEPSGFEISYQVPASPSGGALDSDSNGSCMFDSGGGGSGGGNGSGALGAAAGAAGAGPVVGKNSEQVAWPSGFAPSGSYEVWVKNYDDCGNAPVAFTVTVLHGSSEQTFTGRFPINSVGEGQLVATFVHR